MTQQLHSYHWDALKQALHDVHADQRTWNISKALFKTNPIAAIAYAEAHRTRVHCETPIVKEYLDI